MPVRRDRAMTSGSSNIRSEATRLTVTLTVRAGASKGHSTSRNRSQPVAPSRSAASVRSRGIAA